MTGITQDRLFRLAVEDLHVHAHFVMGQGWQLSFRARRGDETWQEAVQESYSCLSSSELADVIAASVSLVLGL